MSEEFKKFEDLKLKTIIGFNGNAYKGLRVHPDGVHIVYPIGSKLSVLNWKTKEQYFLEGHTNIIATVAISKTGKYVASGQINHMGFQASVIIWDWNTKEIVLIHDTHKVRVESVLFSSCENYIMSLGGRDDANIVVFKIETKETICGTFSSNRNAGDAVTLGAMSLRGICFITGGVSTLKVWTLNPTNRSVRGQDVLMGKIKRKVVCIEIDTEDNYAYCGTSTGDIMKIKLNFSKTDLNNFDPISQPRLIGCFGKYTKSKKSSHVSDLYSMGVRQLILMENNEILVGAGDGTLELVQETNSPFLTDEQKCSKLLIPTLPLFKPIKKTSAGALITSLQRVKNQIFIGTIKSEILILNISSFAISLFLTCHTNSVFALTFPSDYSEVFATASKDDVRIWSIPLARELLRIAVKNFTCSGVLFTNDGRAIITSWNDGHIRAFTPQSGKLIFTILNAHNKGVSAIGITKDGRKLISGGGEGQIRIWCIKKEKQTLIAVMKEHHGPVASVDIAPNDKEAISACTDGTCIIWDLIKCVRITILFSNTLFMCVKYHPSGCQLITCGTNRQIGFWEVFDGALIREIEGSMSSALNTLDVTIDGNSFVTGANDMFVKVWKYKEGEVSHVGIGHPSVVTAVKVSPDMKKIVSCSSDGSIFIWEGPFALSEEKEKRKPSIKEEPTVLSETLPKKDERINSIRSNQSIHSISSQSSISIKSDKHEKASSDKSIKCCAEGGSVKCYCSGVCACQGLHLPTPPPLTPSQQADKTEE